MAISNFSETVPKDVRSYMTFLSRDGLYQTEKPYATDFPVDEIDDAKMTNHIFNTRLITFHDARAAKESFTLNQNGFCFIEAKTSLQAEDAASEKTEIMEQYMQEIVGILRTKLPQYQEIKAMDFQVYHNLLTLVKMIADRFDRFESAIRLFPMARSAEPSSLNRRQWLIPTSQPGEHFCGWPTSFRTSRRIIGTENST